jgi:UDP:flavonoid glycosyltransferase YjiC (YdhE family)
MRLLLATTANAGHFGPMVPFADAWRRAGHEVLVAAPASFAGAVERAGLRHWPCPDVAPDDRIAFLTRFASILKEKRNELTVTMGAELGARSTLPAMLAAFDQWRPDVVLREIGELSSAIAGELRGVPVVQVLIGLAKFVDFTVPLAAPAVADLRASHGLDPDPEGGYLYRQPSLSLLPSSFEEPGAPPVHRFRVPAGVAAPLPRWWDGADAPLVYVTFGTVASGVPFAATAFRTVVEAVADLPARVLVTVGDDGDPGGFGTLPPNVHVERWVPQRDVLAQAALMVNHGGTGTMLGALAAGVPMVVVPQFADQPDNAARIAATGAGLSIGDGETRPPTTAEVHAAVAKVLAGESYRTAVAGFRDEIAALPPVDEAVPLLAAGG